jgi:hypothetical protein
VFLGAEIKSKFLFKAPNFKKAQNCLLSKIQGMKNVKF